MKKIFRSLLPFLLLFTIHDVHAKWLVEPHFAYIFSGKSDTPNSPESYKGPMFGAKFTFFEKEFGFNYGLDFNHSSLDYSSNGSANGVEDGRNELGIFVGYNFQDKYRVWAGYYPYTKAKSDIGDSQSGHSAEFGFGYAVTSRVSLNAYYRLISYSKAEYNGVIQQYPSEQKFTELAVGVSFPYNGSN